MPTIRLDDVSFAYRRRAAAALRGLTLAIEPGVTGLGGPNGAGKTTLLKIILGVVRPTAGRCTIDGAAPDEYRRRVGIGSVPERPVFPDHMTVREFLAGIHALCAGGDPASSEAAPDLVAFGLDGLGDARLARLSAGQRRRVALAAALAGRPELVLMDEPTNGLDPDGIAHLRQVVRGYRDRQVTILIASHHLDELERLVDRIVLLREGRASGVWEREAALATYGSFDALYHATVGAGVSPAEPAPEARR